MKKEQLIEAIADAPDCMDIEVAVKGSVADNIVYRRVIGVERRHRQDIGRDIISLVCLKSLKDERERFAEEDKARRAERKRIISDAALLSDQQEQNEQRAKTERPHDQQPGDQGQGQKPKKRKGRKQKEPTADNSSTGKYDSAFNLDNFGKGAKKVNTFADMDRMIREQLAKEKSDQTGEIPTGRDRYDRIIEEEFMNYNESDPIEAPGEATEAGK